MPETDLWTFIPARHFKKILALAPRKVRVIVIHDMEFPERLTAAEDVARYFATTTTPASAHINVDSDSIVQSVKDGDVAYAAPGANHDGIQVELAGYARQTKKEWLDRYGISMLALAADAVAQYCLKFAIPAVQLSDAQLKDGVSQGIVGHYQVSRVFKKSTHTDPGSGFPWQFFIRQVQNFIEVRR